MSDKNLPPQNLPKISRRKLLKSSAALSTAALLPGCGGGDNGSAASVSGEKPNILFILVDEMRFPRSFPQGINNAGEFLQRFMPNTYKLWQRGVKFANHNTAATACSPSRGVLYTGLYSHQTWFCTTLAVKPGQTHASSPSLQPEFPTYGKLLKAAGYQTPYIGKWHCSQPTSANQEFYEYGFQGFTYPDPIGNNLQGTYGDMTDPNYYYYSDGYIADQAQSWLRLNSKTSQPWCLTVGFQNPHDQEFFPAGTEYQTFTNLYNNSPYNQLQNWSTATCGRAISWENNVTANPPDYGYPAVPPNWERSIAIATTKPTAQTLNLGFSSMYFGGVSENRTERNYAVYAYPYPAEPYAGYSLEGNYGTAMAPFSYWQKALNVYTYLQTVLDQKIGQVIDAIPPEIAQKTIIVFTSDHGDYVGAHGQVAGKENSVYAEALQVPLIVVDPTNTYTGDVDKIRTQLTSSVDIMPMLVSMGYGGQRTWMNGDYQAMYGQRYDMFPLLKSAATKGLDYALFASDEVIAAAYDFATAPTKDGQRTPVHILGMITDHCKLGVYSRWPAGTTTPSPNGQQYEYYSYINDPDKLEINNTYNIDPESKQEKNLLLNVLAPQILEAPLPETYQAAQNKARAALIAFYLLEQSSGRE